VTSLARAPTDDYHGGVNLRVSDLSVAVDGRTLVSGLSFDLEEGARVALVGPSGIGKTMLLRAIALLDDPAGGTITLDGEAPEELGYPEYRRRVAYVMQRPVLFPGSVENNLRRPFSHKAVGSAYPEAEVRAILARLRLDPETFPAEARDLSEGQKQRVALVRALAVRPEVLLLDEPTSGLDAEATEAVEALLAESEAAILWVTHDRVQAERVSDRTIELGGRGG
jgi:putative ABC transport system ATP-binding protein